MMKRISCLLFLFASVGGFVHAQDEFGAWTSLQVGKSWSKCYISFRGEYRSNNDFGGIDSYFLRPTVGYKFLPWLKADLSYDYLYRTGSPQNRWLLSVTASLRQGPLSLSLRERYVGAWAINSLNYSNVLRSFLKGQYKIELANGRCSLSPYVAIEIYAWDKWKQSHHFVGTTFCIGKCHSLDLFYAWNVSASKNHADHVIGVGYNLDL